MIVPMLKYSFLIYHQESTPFMEKLMERGLVHVIDKGQPLSQEVNEQTKRVKNAETVLKALEKRKVKERLPIEKVDTLTLPHLVDFNNLEKELEKAKHQADVYRSEIKHLEPWGEVPWKRLRKLEKEAGIRTRFFSYPVRKFDSDWRLTHALEFINEVGGVYYFTVFHQEEDSALPLVPLVLPKKSMDELKSSLQEIEERIDEIHKILDEYAYKYTHYLRNRIVLAKDNLRFMTAETQVESELEDQLTVLEAWCPKNKVEGLESWLKDEDVVFISTEPEEGEKPPVLLKNNAFTKLFEPIGNMFSLPAYSELDLTVYFAPFFLLFFGFCLGDAGYGVMMLIAATLIKPRVSESMKGFVTLGQLFGLSTTIIGFFSGTLFGIPMLEKDYFAPLHGMMFKSEELFYIALGIGFVQIIFGMCVQVYKQVKFFGWLYALNRIGWIIALLGMIEYFVIEQYQSVSLIAMIVGGMLIVFFGSPKDGWLKSFGFGLADLYNITGIAGDLLSYIRLFALGVSSAILGLVVNSIAASAGGIPYVGMVFTILILVVGHTANLMLASLSAFVHPMRLTFVEFYKNVGFLGGGKPFETFKKNYQPIKNQNKTE